jgi:protein-L-isoaspartate(D-aspartate) O-methyltransferase
MQAHPREQFLDVELRPHAGLDQPLSIGFGATSSPPSIVQLMLELLGVQPGMKVLEIGSGSGWTTTLLAHLTGPTGAVVGVEIVPELVERGRANLPMEYRHWAHIERADPHLLGVPRGEPFDRILVSADPGEIPPDLEDQLAMNGRLVTPAAGVIWVVDQKADGLNRRQAADRHFEFAPLLHEHLDPNGVA